MSVKRISAGGILGSRETKAKGLVGLQPSKGKEDTIMERIPPSERISKEIKDLVSKLEARGKNKEILGKVLEL